MENSQDIQKTQNDIESFSDETTSDVNKPQQKQANRKKSKAKINALKQDIDVPNSTRKKPIQEIMVLENQELKDFLVEKKNNKPIKEQRRKEKHEKLDKIDQKVEQIQKQLDDFIQNKKADQQVLGTQIQQATSSVHDILKNFPIKKK